MIIQSSKVLMESQYLSVTAQVQAQSLQIQRTRTATSPSPTPALSPPAHQEIVDLSSSAYQKLSTSAVDQWDDENLDPKVALIKAIIERLLGRKIRLGELQKIAHDEHLGKTQNRSSQPSQASTATPASTPPAAAPAAQQEAFGLEYHSYEAEIEMQMASFAATGTIRTADGKEINFQVQLEMSREYVHERRIDLLIGAAVPQTASPGVDPLVVNFNGTAAELSDQQFSFDLNLDGTEESIPFVGGNSGLLVLDKNRDGKVNDGSELFGPQSGNGFAELAAYDRDGNQWIDENDPVYEGLQIWTKSAEGQDQLISLRDAGIGALNLGNVATPFDLKDEQNVMQGQVAATGIYLNEDGSVGTLQEINLVA
jgi:hypothetical protein